MKKRLLKLCSIVLVISIVLGNLVSLAADTTSTETTVTTGMTFSEYRKGVIDNPFASSVGTLEAEISLATSEKLTAMGASKYSSIILGTYGKTDASALPQLHFGIYSNNANQAYPLVRYHGASGEAVQTVVFNYNLITEIGTGTKMHLAFVMSEVDGGTNITCYVNGTAVTDLLTGYSQPTVQFNPPQIAYCVGGDYGTNQSEKYFKGEIYSIATYADVRTADEITADKDGIDDTSDENLMAYYDLTSVTDATTKVANGSTTDTNQQYGLNIIETWMTERKPALSDWNKENGDFSIALVGDTQIATEYDVSNGYTDGETGVVSGIYDWLVANKDEKNIQFVMGLGDIVQGTPYAYVQSGVKADDVINNEWDYAVKQIQKLDDANMPYSLIRGNHDAQDKYIENVTYEYYKDSIGGSLDENMLNTWQEFAVNGIKYLVLCLDLGASDTELAWAEEVIKTHPSHNVIITTHGYLNSDGERLAYGDDFYPSQYPSAAYSSNRNDGEDMWNECFSKYDNVVMIVSGHIDSDDIIMTQDTGVNGNKVAQLLVDPQGLDVKLAKSTTGDRTKPTGMVCILNFSADGKTVQVEQISTAYTDETTGNNEYYMNTSQFTFEMDVVKEQKLLFDDKLMTVGMTNETTVRPFASEIYNCAINNAQIILAANRTMVISYTAPSDGLIKITDMDVKFHGDTTNENHDIYKIINKTKAANIEFAVTDEEGKIISNNGRVLNLSVNRTSVTGMSIEAQEIEKGESIYFVFHSIEGSDSITLNCIPEIYFSDDDGDTWGEHPVSRIAAGYNVPWPYNTDYNASNYEQGMGGFYYQYSTFYEKVDYSKSNERVVVHTRRMDDPDTTATTQRFNYKNVTYCATGYGNIIVKEGYTNVISYEAPKSGKIWIDDLYVYTHSLIASDGTVPKAEFVLIDENGRILSNNGKIYTVEASTAASVASKAASNLAPVLYEVDEGERIYFIFHGVTGTMDMRCNANIQFCADGETTWTCVSAYSTAGAVNINSLRDPDSTSISNMSQGKGDFYYEYSEAYGVTDKTPEYINISEDSLTLMEEHSVHSDFPYEQSTSSALCMTSKSEILTSAGYTNVISYKVPATGILYVGGEDYVGMKVWINNAKAGLKSEFAVLDEEGKILTNCGQKYEVTSDASGATAAKAAAKGLSFTKNVTEGEMIYFVFHGLEGNAQSMRCNASIWLSTDDGATWNQMNDAPKPTQVALYSKNGYDGGGDNAATTVEAGQGVDGFYYQYLEANTAYKSGITIGDETEGVVTVYDSVKADTYYCDKYVVDEELETVDSVTKVKNYIDLDMLNIKTQSKVNKDESAKTDVRYIASIDSLDYESVGFVFSINSEVMTPKLEDVENEVSGVAYRYTNTVYARVNEDNGSRKVVNLYAEDGCKSMYGFAFEMRKTPPSTTVYARAYVELSNGTIVYGTPRAVTTPETNTEG